MRLLAAALIALIPASAASPGESAAAASQIAIDSPSPPTMIVVPQRSGDMPVIDPSPDPTGHCPPISRYEAAKRGGKLSPELLNELPAADLYQAVYRKIDGCVAPIITAYGIGGTSPLPRAGER